MLPGNAELREAFAFLRDKRKSENHTAVRLRASFATWAPVLDELRLPVALVAQDGLEELEIPWEQINAVFIGGSTAWKLGADAAAIAAEAKRRGLKVTAEATPHHFALADRDMQPYDSNFKMKPPLREARDVCGDQPAVLALESVVTANPDVVIAHRLTAFVELLAKKGPANFVPEKNFPRAVAALRFEREL